MGVGLRDDGTNLILTASITRDPRPDVADDEYSFVLRTVFDKDALAEIPIDQDHVISGEASWPDTGLDSVFPSDVTFVGGGSHIAAIQQMYFVRSCGFCGAIAGSHTIQGSLRLTANRTSHLTGLIEARIEGGLPGSAGTMQLYDLTLTFDLDVAE